MGSSCATVNSDSCPVTLLPPSLYNASSRMIRECISCGSVLLFRLLPKQPGAPGPVTVGPDSSLLSFSFFSSKESDCCLLRSLSLSLSFSLSLFLSLSLPTVASHRLRV
ncbi:Hypothetical predicted protein [Xyrichtys novacula]|uniref:Uncharacterized protein n=1 Tax=Xyrichtys novacula TaxID=13765 RepID=A0AAV1FI03_XYRNO|nr:Hypothetical predicted protein [Xyrichtys novacula]